MRHHFTSFLKSTSAMVLAAALAVPALAYGEKIKIGMVSTFNPSFAKSEGLLLGMRSYFKRINDTGGIRGQKIEVIVRDDNFKPERSGKLTRQLIDEEGVLAFLGNMGTPPATVTSLIAKEKKTLLMGPYSGASKIRGKDNRYLIHYRASYANESEKIIQSLVNGGVKPELIYFVVYDNSYGRDAYASAVKALEAMGHSTAQDNPVGFHSERYKDIERAVATILSESEEPEAIVFLSVPEGTGAFLKWVKPELPDVLYIGISPTGANTLFKHGGDITEGVMVTQVTPHHASDLPGVVEYREDIEAYDPQAKPGYFSLEGYILGRMLVKGLRNIQGEITRESLVVALENLGDFDVGIGSTLTLSPKHHQASQNVWLSVVRDGRLQSADWSSVVRK